VSRIHAKNVQYSCRVIRHNEGRIGAETSAYKRSLYASQTKGPSTASPQPQQKVRGLHWLEQKATHVQKVHLTHKRFLIMLVRTKMSLSQANIKRPSIPSLVCTLRSALSGLQVSHFSYATANEIDDCRLDRVPDIIGEDAKGSFPSLSLTAKSTHYTQKVLRRDHLFNDAVETVLFVPIA
jgi:hypothetical protein